MPEPIAPRDVALDVVWKHIATHGRRPTSQDVDRALYRDRGVRGEVISALPEDLFTIAPPAAGGRVEDGALIGLTAAGVRAAGGGARELELFLMIIRQAADREREFEPASQGDRFRLTASDVSAFNRLGDSGTDALLPRVGEILRAEHWGGTWIQGTDPHWTFEIDRGVRRFVGVPDLDTYFQVRNQTPPSLAPPRFDALFWTGFAAVFAVVAAFLTGIQQWSVLRTLTLLAAVTAAVLALHRRRLDLRTRVYGVVAVMCAAGFGWTFWG
ncbi:hypothetical protein [Streptomyces olivaceus]|uniref:hypothetical protein n=1 Tax=Streptomyces olivaceus TaxID=47716 RepID=UPI003626D033